MEVKFLRATMTVCCLTLSAAATAAGAGNKDQSVRPRLRTIPVVGSAAQQELVQRLGVFLDTGASRVADQEAALVEPAAMPHFAGTWSTLLLLVLLGLFAPICTLVAQAAVTVTSTVPLKGAVNVPVSNALAATFSEAMDPGTINTNTFTLKQGGASVAGAVSYSGITAKFTPSSGLLPFTSYTARISSKAESLNGKELEDNYSWSFTTGAIPDTTPPTVSSTTPNNGAVEVSVSSSLAATFSEPMDPLTISTATFTVKQGGAPVAGAVSYSGGTVTFTPSSPLAPNVPFTATITSGAQDLAGNPLAANYSWSFTTGAIPDTTPPTVSSTTPNNGAVEVSVSSSLSATFSESMDPFTISTATFTVKQGGAPVAGAVSYSGGTVTFTPSSPLAPNVPFTATITSGAQDLAGNALAADYSWTFTTGATPDTTPPTVSSTTPNNGAAKVSVGNSLSATFSESMDPFTISTATFTVKQGGAPVAGAVSYSGGTVTFTPTSRLAPNVPFTATITSGAQDLAGNALAADYFWTFTTGATPDTTPPTVSSTTPNNGHANVSVDDSLSATFSESMDPFTISTATFTVKQGGAPVAGAVKYSGGTVTFKPTSRLAPNVPFTATITSGAQDLAGNALAADYFWTFTTGATPDTTPPTVSSTTPNNGHANVSVDDSLSATFSESMDPFTISTATFTVKQGGAPVAGAVKYSGGTVTFKPTSRLAPNVPFTATITSGAQDLAGNALAADYFWTFTTGATPDTTPPTVSATAPRNGAANVSVDDSLSATFSESMDPFTISTATFTVKQGGAPVAGAVKYSGGTVTFKPTSQLAPNVPFTATITSGAQDLARNALAADYSWTFATGATPDATPPTVSSTLPYNAAVKVPVSNALSATFSEAMDPLTINTATFTVKQGGAPVAGAVSYSGVTIIFTLASPLAPNTPFTATITSGAEDLAGNALAADYSWTFTTGATSDTTPPRVTSTAPYNVAANVPVGNALSVTFSEAMDPLTINTATFTVKQGGATVAGAVSYSGITVTFKPASPLAPNTPFTATISTGAEDLAENALAADYVWTFTTGTTSDTTAPTVSSTVPVNGASNVPGSNALAATFSEAMGPLTISTATFTLEQGGASVAGAVSYSGVTVNFTPASPLAPNTPFTATITSGAEDLAENALAADYVWTFTTGATPDTTAPTVSSTSPNNGAANVSRGNALSATFSEAMDPLTINTATFTLEQGGALVAGAVSYSGVTVNFTPASPLAPNVPFTATISTDAEDLAENALAADYVWTFTTGSTLDTTAPTVSSTTPYNGAANVSRGNALSATFSEAMDPLTVNTATFTLEQGGAPVVGAVSYSGITVSFKPASPLAPNVPFTATISTDAEDLAENALAADYVWTFTTGSSLDTTAPTVSSTVPLSGAANVPVGNALAATFSEPMDPLTISTATFSLTAGTTPVRGEVSYSGGTATFRPVNILAANTTYTAAITTGVTDLAGNALAADYVWTFLTGATPGQLPVCLTDFAILSGSAVISSGLTTVTGNVGVSPGTSVIGFPPGTLSGLIHAGDADAARAMASAFAGYADAVSRSIGAVAISGDLGDQALTPGLYRSSSSLTISSGDVTLDAKGDGSAVFIFQSASTLTSSAGRKVVLAGGAKASNVFWQVGTSAILGADSEFSGSVLADESIMLNAGATLSGRLLAIHGTITLASNAITGPVPEVTAGGVLNSAGWSPTVAAGSIAAVFGNNLATALNVASTFPLPTMLGVSSFQVGTQGAPLYMASCGQANVQIPWEVAGQTAVPVTVTVNELESLSQFASVAPFAPGIYTLNMSGSGQGAVEIAPSDQLAAPLAPGARPIVAGEYIAVFATGLGPVTNHPETGAAALSDPLSITTTTPTVTIGGVAAPVTYSGLAPGFAGLYQVNALVPQGTPSGDSISVVISIGGVESNTVTIAVQ